MYLLWGDLGSARISTNVCHRINQQFPRRIFCWVLASRGWLWKSFRFSHQSTRAPPTWVHMIWWVMMKAQVDGRKASPSSSACTALPLAQEWRFAGSCCAHKALLVPLACRDPRVSSAPEGETNKKAPLSHAEAALWHVCLFFTTGLRSSLRRGMTERTDFRNRASGKQNCCCFKLCIYIFFKFKCHFHPLLASGGFPPLLSSLDSELFVLCCCINTFWAKLKKAATNNRHITHYIYIAAWVTIFRDNIYIL